MQVQPVSGRNGSIDVDRSRLNQKLSSVAAPAPGKASTSKNRSIGENKLLTSKKRGTPYGTGKPCIECKVSTRESVGPHSSQPLTPGKCSAYRKLRSIQGLCVVQAVLTRRECVRFVE